MDIAPFKLLLLDAAGHAVLVADGPSGKILAELPLPTGMSPVDLAAHPAAGIAFVALAGPGGSGALCRFTLARPALDRLPLALPHPARMALAPDGSMAFLADAAGSLYALALPSLTLKPWGRPDDCGPCAGLALQGERLWGVWESDAGGLLAAFAADGRQEGAYRLGGLPTNLACDLWGRLLVPFTASHFSGEGLLIVEAQTGKSTLVPILCSRCAAGYTAFPVHAAVRGDTAYVACEDSAAIAIIDLAAGKVSGTISLGHSISRLALLADGRFAVAASNATAELALIDLVNRRPLSFTASGREILSSFALIEC